MCFSYEQVCNCLYRCYSLLFVLVRSRVTCVFTYEQVCDCLFMCYSMLFALVRSRFTCVFTYEQVCDCLGVHHIWCCVFCFVFPRLVYPMLQVSLDLSIVVCSFGFR
jgi:hypothetical protein